VDELVAMKRAAEYDQAIALLCDLRDLAVREDRVTETEERLLAFREQYAARPALIRRLDAAGLRVTRSHV
jgi:hypothetical protein